MRVHRVRAVLPVLKPDEVLRDALVPDRAFALVGLVQFLRELVGERWQAPPLRAAIIFDDPNLRRPSYGYIDYRGLAAHADTHGYHAAMAMIPRDARRPHARRRQHVPLRGPIGSRWSSTATTTSSASSCNRWT